MRIATTIMAAAATAATTGAVGIAVAPMASASYPNTKQLGAQEQLVDANGAVLTGLTVSNLQPSTDVIPYPVHGHLWQATATVRAVRGTVTPIIPDFNARAATGQNYPELAGVATAQGLNPAPLPQGDQTTGKLYFDAVGPAPDSVVYNDGTQDLLVWTGGGPVNHANVAGYSATNGNQPAVTPATDTATDIPADNSNGGNAGNGSGSGPGVLNTPTDENSRTNPAGGTGPQAGSSNAGPAQGNTPGDENTRTNPAGSSAGPVPAAGNQNTPIDENDRKNPAGSTAPGY